VGRELPHAPGTAGPSLAALAVVVLALLAMACTTRADVISVGEIAAAESDAPTATTEAVPPPSVDTAPTVVEDATTTTVLPFARPDWLGTRVLPLRDDEFGEVQPTPPELRHRQLLTLDVLAPPARDEYVASVSPVPDDVLARSSWKQECPVTVEELSYLTMTHWGFDGRVHTGEMIVNASVADDIVSVFRQLFAARFPLEQMRVIDEFEIDLPPTGDWNDTTSFVCRDAVGSGTWSQHAFGLAVDINPFHNPYLKGDLVLPELASYYVDRERNEPGMIAAGDAAFQAFADIGWSWGGNWNSLKDWMHFSQNGH